MRRIFTRVKLALAAVVVSAATACGVAIVASKPTVSPAESIQRPPREPQDAADGEKAAAEKRRWPVVAAAGDVACDPQAPTFRGGFGSSGSCRQEYTAQLVEDLDPDAVLVLGDDQYDDGSYRDYLRSYDRSWGRFKRISYPTPGDPRAGSSLKGYFRYWGSRARPAGEPWYSFSVGDWHVVSLNSNCGRVGGCGPGSPQFEWLRADLAAHPAACQLAFSHEPRFSSTDAAGTDSLEAIWELLSDFHVELLVSGDAHNYERFGPQDAHGRPSRRGVRQFVVGTGGKSLTAFGKRTASSERRKSTTFGVLKLVLRAESYSWRFLPLSESFEDAGSSSCHE